MSADRLTLSLALERLRLKAPFRISGYVFTDVAVAVVTLGQDGREGRGEAAGVYYLGDTPERIVETIECHRAVIENGITRPALRELLPAGGARNALDCALWELEARGSGKPVWQLAGLDAPRSCYTTFTLGAEDPAAMAETARSLTDARALKLKLSGELDLDVRRVQSVRAARPGVWLGVDANQGYTLDTLRELLPVLVKSRVLLLEQPLRRGAEAELEGLKCPIPLAADESVQDLAEVAGLVGRFDVVNIKLDKCGGLTEALLMADEARRLGLEVMVGNMIGSSLAMAPAFVLAQLCEFVDLDGPTFLAADRKPSVVYEHGQIRCPPQVWGAKLDTIP